MDSQALALSLAPSSSLIHRQQLCCSLRNYEQKLSTFAASSLAQNCEPRRLRLHMYSIAKKLRSVTPQPLRNFPFREAEVVFLRQLLLAGKKAVKQSLLVLYMCSFISDIVYSVSQNKELIIPLGLFVGCIVTNFLTEMSKELFPMLEDNDLRLHLVGSIFLFALTKIISSFFMVPGRIFLLQFANGGLMQALWQWKKNSQMNEDDQTSIDKSTNLMA